MPNSYAASAAKKRRPIGLQVCTTDYSLITTHSARNLGFIFDEHLTFSDQISALSKSCYYHIPVSYTHLTLPTILRV